MNIPMAALAFLTLLGFLLVLVIEVPSLDLMMVALLTIGLVAYDFATSAGDRRD